LATGHLQNSDGVVPRRSNSGFVATIRAPISGLAPEWNSSTTGCPPLGEPLFNHHQHVGGTGGRKHEIERVARVPDALLISGSQVRALVRPPIKSITNLQKPISKRSA
jgi:hypothetical protein